MHVSNMFTQEKKLKITAVVKVQNCDEIALKSMIIELAAANDFTTKERASTV